MVDPAFVIRLAFDIVVLLAGAAYVAGQRRAKLQLGEVKEWRRQIDARQDKHERETEDRFDEASRQSSRLSSIVQALPVQIEDRVMVRCRDLVTGELRAPAVQIGELARRTTAQEERCSRLMNSAHPRG